MEKPRGQQEEGAREDCTRFLFGALKFMRHDSSSFVLRSDGGDLGSDSLLVSCAILPSLVMSIGLHPGQGAGRTRLAVVFLVA